ncbi:MAG: CPBP family intramembrane metalloprotease [Polyangiaceae bacterium]|nr:CPBP family intramembrane metalloprotease [Polyangiaceae bacterium]
MMSPPYPPYVPAPQPALDPTRPLTASGAVLTLVVAFVACQITAAIALAAAMVGLGVFGLVDLNTLREADAAKKLLSHPVMLVAATGATGLTLVGTAFVAAKIGKRRFWDMIAVRKPKWFHVPLAIGMVLGAGPFADLAVRGMRTLFPSFTLHTLETIGEAAQGTAESAVVLTIVIAVIPGIGEEIFFRGMLQRSFVARLGAPAGVALASVLFGAFHLDPPQAAGAAVLGGALGFVSIRTGTIVPAMVAHAFNNALAMVAVRFSEPDTAPTEESAPVPLLVFGAVLMTGCVFGLLRTTQKPA